MRGSYRGLSQAERVRLYTLQSVYGFLWGAPLLYALTSNAGAARALLVSLLGLLLTCAAATWLMRAGIAHYLDPGPLPLRPLVATAVLAVATVGLTLAAGLDLQGRLPVLLGVAWVVGWSAGTFREPVVLWPSAILVAAQGALLGLGWGVLPALIVALFAAFTIRLSLWIMAVVMELDRARDAQASLAVAEERLRFSRDVHDVLGRDLSTIAVTSELAATLARRGDPTAPDKMLEVRAMAGGALRQARELARGYRAPDLDQEVSGARELLAAAGIEVRAAVDGVPEPWREVVALTVREGVTNVLRHSQAGHVEMAWEDRSGLVLRNDGVTADPASDGTGLLGLRERVEPLGGRVDVRRDEGWFELRLVPHREEVG